MVPELVEGQLPGQAPFSVIICHILSPLALQKSFVRMAVPELVEGQLPLHSPALGALFFNIRNF